MVWSTVFCVLTFFLFLYPIDLFLLFLVLCLCVGLCTWVQCLAKAQASDPSGAWNQSRRLWPTLGRYSLTSSERAAHTLNPEPCLQPPVFICINFIQIMAFGKKKTKLFEVEIEISFFSKNLFLFCLHKITCDFPGHRTCKFVSKLKLTVFVFPVFSAAKEISV